MATDAVLIRSATAVASPRDAGAGRSRALVGGVLIDRADRALVVEQIGSFLRSGKCHQVATVNLDFLNIADRDRSFRDALNRADLVVADGMPIVWLSGMRQERIPERLAGVDLVNEACSLAAEDGRGIYLLGAAPGVADAAAFRLLEQHPGLRIAGTYAPPYRALSPEEDLEIVRAIRSARPAFLFVAFGAPRQDLWIREHLADLEVPVAMGVGCAFDVIAGRLGRAPFWMQRAGLEWAYRLAHEPGRLWKRYLVDDVPLLARLIVNRGSGGSQ